MNQQPAPESTSLGPENSQSKPIHLHTLPRSLQGDLAASSADRMRWAWSIVPALAGAFIWVPFLDQLPIALLGSGPPFATCAWSLLAFILGYGLLYLLPAERGRKAGHPLSIVASSTFGTVGSAWLTGPVFAFAAIVWYAASIYFAVRLIFLGLISFKLLEPSSLDTLFVEAVQVHLPLFLVTSLFWIFITGMANLLRLTGVISALMQVYTPVALFLLIGVAVSFAPGLPSFTAGRVGLIHEGFEPVREPFAGAHVVQVIFAYMSFVGMMVVEWGGMIHTRREVRLGGWLGILGVGSVAAVAVILAVAGAVGKMADPNVEPVFDISDPHPLSLQAALFRGLGGVSGGALLSLFGLATLAPSCYAAWNFSRRLALHWPKVRRFFWTWIGAIPAFLMIATTYAGRMDLVVPTMGAIFAPAVGAICTDSLRQKGEWRGVRLGINPAGILAWAVGFAVGLAPVIGPRAGLAWTAQIQPASLLSFVVAGALYLVLAMLGLESPTRPLPAPHAGSGPGVTSAQTRAGSLDAG